MTAPLPYIFQEVINFNENLGKDFTFILTEGVFTVFCVKNVLEDGPKKTFHTLQLL